MVFLAHAHSFKGDIGDSVKLGLAAPMEMALNDHFHLAAFGDFAPSAAFDDFNPSAAFDASAPSPDVEVDALLTPLDVPGNIDAAVRTYGSILYRTCLVMLGSESVLQVTRATLSLRKKVMLFILVELNLPDFLLHLLLLSMLFLCLRMQEFQ